MTANKLTILKSIDDVRIFPSINIPAPIFIDTPKQVILKGIKTTKVWLGKVYSITANFFLVVLGAQA